MDKFSPEWWRTEGPAYLAAQPRKQGWGEQEAWIGETIGALIAGPGLNSIIEFGTGTGRIANLLRARFGTPPTPEPKAYVRSRWSVPPPLPGPLEFRATDIGEIELGAGLLPAVPRADLSLAVEVLMHIPPERIELAVSQLVGFARKWVLTVDWWEFDGPPAEGCYRHDYPALFTGVGQQFSPYGCVRVTPIPEARQALFLTEVHRG